MKQVVLTIDKNVQIARDCYRMELVGDISVNGIVMSGGGSLIWGLDKLVTSRTGIEAVVVDDPLACAAYGAGKMLRELAHMQDGMINLARRKQMK